MSEGYEYTGAGMIDRVVCKECGWQSRPYFDGEPYAVAEWEKHNAEHHEKDNLATQLNP